MVSVDPGEPLSLKVPTSQAQACIPLLLAQYQHSPTPLPSQAQPTKGPAPVVVSAMVSDPHPSSEGKVHSQMGRHNGRSFGNLSDKDAPMSRIADKHPLARRYITISTGG